VEWQEAWLGSSFGVAALELHKSHRREFLGTMEVSVGGIKRMLLF